MDPTQDPSLAVPNTPNFINPAYATPQQRLQLYQYANALMQPQPIKSGWQGLASIANALVGGYMGHQADLAEQGGTLADQQRQQIINQASGANGALAPAGATSSPAGGMPVSPAPDAGGNAAPDFYTTAANHESRNQNISNSAGGDASGYYQFTPGTWQTVAGSHPELNLPGDVQSASKAQQDAAYRALATDNAGQLDAAGIPINDKNVFMASFLGAGGAKKFFGAAGQNPNAPAAAIFPREAAANPNVFYADAAHKQPLSLAQVYQKTTGSFGTDNTTGYVPIAARGQPPAPSIAGNGPAVIPAPSAAQPSPATGQPPPPAPGGLGYAPTVPPVTWDAYGNPSSIPLPPIRPRDLGSPPPAPSPGGMGNAPAVPPAVAAMGAALRGGQAPPAGASAPMPAPGGTLSPPPGVTPQQLAFAMSSPNMSPAQKMQLQEWAQPKTYQDVTGNVSTSYFNQPTGAPIFHGGARGPDIAGAVPTILGGPPTNPTSTLAIPQVAGSPPIGRGGLVGAPPVPPAAGGATSSPVPPPNVGAAIFAPGTPVGDIIAAKQASDARGAATTNVAGGSADQYVRDMQGAINYQRSALPLQKAIPALEKLGTTGTGPGTETWNEVMSFLQSSGMPGIDTSKIKDFDEAKKYLTDYVNQNGDHATNDRLAASFAGNPSVGISNAAAVDVAKTAATMQRYKQAQVMSFGGAMDPTTGQPMSKDKYLDYAANFQSKYDPRAFGIDMMAPPAIAALDKEMPVGSDAREKFNRSLKMAKDLGLVTR